MSFNSEPFRVEIREMTCETCPMRDLPESYWQESPRTPYDTAIALAAVLNATRDGELSYRKAVWEIDQWVMPVMSEKTDGKLVVASSAKPIAQCVKRQVSAPCTPPIEMSILQFDTTDGVSILKMLLTTQGVDLREEMLHILAAFEDMALQVEDPELGTKAREMRERAIYDPSSFIMSVIKTFMNDQDDKKYDE